MKASRYPSGLSALVTMADVCLAIKVSRRTLQRLIHTGAFPKPDRRAGKGLRWKQRTVEQWINES